MSTPTTARRPAVRLANPRRTSLATLKAGSRCEVERPGCQGTATRLVRRDGSSVHTCSTC